MASSRLEKIGTIFTRVDGLLKAGGMKYKERPLWYDVYKAFPPQEEPRYARPVPNIPIRNIFYEEDKIRAKFHKHMRSLPNYNLMDNTHKTATQQFIAIYNKLKGEGALDDEQVFTTALDLLQNEMAARKEEFATRKEESAAKREELAAKKDETSEKPQRPSDEENVNINIKDIFK